MSVIPFKGIVSFTAEHHVHKVKNLLSGGQGKWTCPTPFAEKSIEVELSLPPCYIEGVDIGNYGSTSIEIQVNRSDDPVSKRESLILNTVLMTRTDWVKGINKETMSFLGKEIFNPKVAEKWWDRMRIICHHPYSVSNFDIFGLSAVIVRGRRLQDENVSAGGDVKMVERQNAKSGIETLMKKVDKHLPGSKSTLNASVNALENTRFSLSGEPTLTSPISRAGKLVQESSRPKSPPAKTNLELKFEANSTLKSSRKRPRDTEPDDRPSLDRHPDISFRNNVSMFDTSVNSKDEHKYPKASGSKTPTSSKIKPKTEKNISSATSGANKTAPSFEYPQLLKNFSREELRSSKILVQTRQYKHSKQLPLKGKKQVVAEKGQTVTFYKQGSKILMEIGDKIYHPEVEAEHVAGIFKDFSQAELAANDLYEEKAESADDDQKCPLCEQAFVSERELVQHCATCEGVSDEEPCPICGVKFPTASLPNHAELCAQTMFDN